MIAVTFALPAEGRDFARRLEQCQTRSIGRLKVVSGKIDETEIDVVHTGVGLREAELRIRIYLGAALPRFLIAAGFAGATRSGQQLGGIILGDNYSDPALLGRAEEALRGLTVTRGVIFTAPEVIDKRAAREELWRQKGVVAVEMESSVIVSAASERNIPVLALRSVSDTPEHPFPLPPRILFDVDRQRTVLRRLAGHLVANPRALPRLIRFTRQVRTARQALAEALVRVITTLARADSV